MANPHPHVFTPEERGHRPALYKGEQTVPYTVNVRQATKDRLREAGTRRVRELLDRFAEGVE